jgi:hypothetical protein
MPVIYLPDWAVLVIEILDITDRYRNKLENCYCR